MEATVQVRRRGTLTLPAELRAKYDIKEADTFRVIDLDGLLVLTPMAPMLPELAREIGRSRKDAGLSMVVMLKGWPRQRKRYHKEKDGLKDGRKSS